MNSKRFAIFSAQFLPSVGGVEKYTDNLAHELARQGHEVMIVTTDASASSGLDRVSEGVEVVRLPCVSLLGGRMPVPRKSAEFKHLWRLVESRSYDGVLVNTRFYIHSLLGLRLAKKQGLRAVLCEHGSAYLTLGNSVVDKVIAMYEHMITTCVKRYNPDFYAVSIKGIEWLQTFRIRSNGVLSNAIDAEIFRGLASKGTYRAKLGLRDDAFLASFVGRFIPEKGIDAMIEAMRILGCRGVPVVLAMAGSGPLESRIRDAGLSNIVVLGKLCQADIASLMIDSDVFCLPTRSEGFSTSLLEAAACATPAIITNVGGVAEVIPDSSYGTVIADANPSTIAAALQYAISHKEDLDKQGLRCYERVRSLYSWERTAQAMIEACENANR